MKCIIVDDEPIARLGMKKLIEQVEESDLELVGSFSNAKKASEFMVDNEVDLVFLDIQMPGITGLEFARSIPRSTLIVFTTAFSEYAVEGFETDAIDYLLKPIELNRFQKAVDKALAYQALLKGEKSTLDNFRSDHFFVKSERRFVRVIFSDILFIEGLKDYIIIRTLETRIVTKMVLKSVETLLPRGKFFRVNKSYIVNMDKIESYNNNDVVINGLEIAISVGYKEAFFKVFLNH